MILIVYQRYVPDSLTVQILDLGFRSTELLEEESQFSRAFLHPDRTRIATESGSGKKFQISGEESEMISWLKLLGFYDGASLVHTPRL